jgi:Malonate decarboxylase, alpha subunit, transporter
MNKPNPTIDFLSHRSGSVNRGLSNRISQRMESLPRPISACSSGASRASSTSPIRARKGLRSPALATRKIELGAIHTYIELFARYLMDLTPHVALIAAVVGSALLCRAAVHPRSGEHHREPDPDGHDGHQGSFYGEYGVRRLNHGFGFRPYRTAAADLRRPAWPRGLGRHPSDAEPASSDRRIAAASG